MALQTIKGGLWIPKIVPGAAANLGTTSMLINASGEKAAHIIRVPETGTLDKFEWLLSTFTQATNGVRCSFQDVSLTTGDPDGTQDQYRDITTGLASNTWQAPGLMTSDGTDGGTKRAVTKGDLLACVVEYVTFATNDSLNVEAFTNDATAGCQGFPYSDLFTASWAKQTAAPIMALQYNDGSYEYCGGDVYPRLTTIQTGFNSGSTPDERGLIFQFPFPCKISGAWFRATLAAGLAPLLKLYDSDGSTALESITIDTDVVSATTGKNFFHYFTADRQLLANTNYRLTLVPQTATNITLHEFTTSTGALMDGCEGGQNFHATERTDAGAWTQTTTRRPWMGVLVTALGDDVGGGSTVIQRRQIFAPPEKRELVVR